jgi:hypothetical protein
VERCSFGKRVDKKQVQFSGFDLSSTKPPRDNLIGSHLDREETITALATAIGIVKRMADTTDDNKKALVSTCLESLSNYLQRMEQDEATKGDDVDDSIYSSAELRFECSRVCKQRINEY